MAKAKHMAAEAIALTAAERLARVRMRLDETRAQIADVAARIDDRRRGLDGLQHLAQSERERAKDAERAHEVAAEQVVEMRVGVMLAEGTDGESAAREALAAAERSADERAAERDAARLSAAEIDEKARVEQHAIRTAFEQDEVALTDLRRLLASLERQEKTAHAAAGLERLAQLRAERAALDARRAELREMAAAADADLEASAADVAALTAEWPDLRGTHEVRELQPAVVEPLHEVAAAGIALCDVLEKHTGSQAVSGFWRDQQNVPLVLAKLGGDLVRDLFTVYGGNVLPQLRIIRAGLRALDEAACGSVPAPLPRVLEQSEQSEGEGDVPSPAA